MENVKQTLMSGLQEVFNDTKMASTLLESGKEIATYQKLQGVRAKLVKLIEWTNADFPENVAQEDT